MRKIFSAIIGIIIINSMLHIPAAAFEKIIVSNITTLSGVAQTCMPASGEHTKSGDFTMQWSGNDIFKNVSIPVSVSDWSNGGYLEVWVYSKAANNSLFAIILESDNSETTCLDYYHTTVKNDWIGWKLLSFALDSDFGTAHKPIGLHNIQKISLWSNYAGMSLAYGTALFFDDFVIAAEKSEEALGEEGGTGEILMLADFSKRAVINTTGFPASDRETLDGNQLSLKMAGSDLFSKELSIQTPPDWSGYSILNMWIHSAQANGSTLIAAAISDDPETAGTDYYKGDIILDWTGWKQVQLFIGTTTTMSKSRSPLGWNNISALKFWTSFGGVSVDAGTVLHIDSIFLSKNSVDKTKDYILPAQSRENDIDIAASIKEKNPEKQHPRLLFNQEYLTQLKTLKDTDPYLKKSYQNLINSAEAATETVPQEYEYADGLRLSRTSPDMMPVLALAYNLSGDMRYADRLWQELEMVCAFPDWNPNHFLDVGDYARGVAYAYDWMYNHWNEEQRRIVRNGIMNHGFKPAMMYLRNGTFFFSQTTNWNQVINSGLGLAALAIADESGYDAISNEVLNRVIEGLPNAIAEFAPDGASIEGISYWEYAQETFFQFDAGLFSAAGTDFGLNQMEGLSKTGYFPISMAGSTRQSFNFGDGYAGLILNPVLFWISRLYDLPDISSYVLELQPNGGNWGAMALYRSGDEHVDFRQNIAKDVLFKGRQNVASMRSSWYDDDALFVAFKGGDNTIGHGDLDIGGFVLDALGVRWATELGSETYNASGMFENAKGGARWTYYRKRAEGNNTLVINPDNEEDQAPDAIGEIISFKESDSAAYGIIDMKEAYRGKAADAKRGIALINNRSAVLIQDEIKTMKPSEIYSFIHTITEIDISDDGKKAIMSFDDKRMRVDLLEPSDASLIVMEALPLSTSPNPEGNNPNIGYRKLAAHLNDAVNPTISMLFTPLRANQPDEISLPEVLPLSQWDAYLESSAAIQSLTVDGIPISGFTPYNTAYTFVDGIVSTVDAQIGSDYSLEITQAQNVGDTAFVKVISPGGEQLTYCISFDEKAPAIVSEKTPFYEIVAVKASDVPQPENKPENAFDGDIATRWSAEGEQWIQFDMGGEYPVSSLMVAFHNGTTRRSSFGIELSADGQTWQTVYEGQSSGKTEDLEEYDFAKSSTRYVRICGKGNTSNKWNSVTEVRIPIPPIAYTDMEGHWAQRHVQDITLMGIVSGVGDALFAPEQPVTRAEFIAMVARAIGVEGLPPDTGITEQWHTGIIDAAQRHNLLPDEMVTEGDIHPDMFITREEMCAILVRAYEREKGSETETYGLRFKDADTIAPWAVKYVEKGVALRLVAGVSKTEFLPANNATRAQASVLVKRLFYKLNL